MTNLEAAAPVGEILREWRERRRFSQQELSNLSAVSTRHLSRVETGRAHPTSAMVLRLADHLDVPLRSRNRLLLAAGYAPRYPDHTLHDSSLAAVMAGLRGLLDAHLPFPALLLDDYWDVVDTNAAVDRLLVGCAPELLEPPVNVLRLSVHPGGLAARIENLEEWATHLHHQVASRAERTGDPRHHELAGELAAHRVEHPPNGGVDGPVLTMNLSVEGTLLRLFSTTARLTTVTDAALEGLHLETFLPADDATREFLTR
ncbi:MAG TPA: helix-turn-helix transcriptional regulator [Candidatus Ruania gallistercoris]|uniref:Helix-turn-helix transcriptional regulator n=1 Tax=Candidatus Ruania gallistercoris TaxID=2838746 RepID=A0A9D2J2W2_9MICO|nr:helix-turn-helix transcriptional regulator [Candidatus Ruania gallistercoris]